MLLSVSDDELVPGGHGAPEGRDDARGHRGRACGEPERVADGDDRVADDRERWSCRRSPAEDSATLLILMQRDVVDRVGADQRGLEALGRAGSRHRDGSPVDRGGDDVVVGDDQSVGRDDHARSLVLFPAPLHVDGDDEGCTFSTSLGMLRPLGRTAAPGAAVTALMVIPPLSTR